MAPDRHDTMPPSLVAVAALFTLALMIAGYHSIGAPPVVIVGGSGIVGIGLWVHAYRHGPIAPEVVLPPFLLTVAALEVHMIEEYVAGFGPAMSRLFDICWTEFGFLLVFAFVGPILYALTALGLFRRVRLAGFVACFIFVGPGAAEITHFVFPLLEPALAPHDPRAITQAVANGRVVRDMPNYWYATTGRYYFPGLLTALLPMLPGLYGIRAMWRRS